MADSEIFYQVYPVRCRCGKPIGGFQSIIETKLSKGIKLEKIMNDHGIVKPCCRTQILNLISQVAVPNKAPSGTKSLGIRELRQQQARIMDQMVQQREQSSTLNRFEYSNQGALSQMAQSSLPMTYPSATLVNNLSGTRLGGTGLGLSNVGGTGLGASTGNLQQLPQQFSNLSLQQQSAQFESSMIDPMDVVSEPAKPSRKGKEPAEATFRGTVVPRSTDIDTETIEFGGIPYELANVSMLAI
jgi:DNA-directed RNA polymerase subunit N (RpoN/RPB10)